MLLSDENCSKNDKPCCTCCDSQECDIEKGTAIGNDILENGDDFLLETQPILLPSWYNHRLMTSGQDFFQKNYFGMFVCKLSGLLTILAVPSILKVLRNTEKSSSSGTAYKRYMGTINNMLYWYESDMRNPNSKGRQSIASVRRQHFAASNYAGPISQKDLALTQFGFVGFAVIAYERLGLAGDMTGLIHFWRVIGHLIGIQDRFNICQGNMKCTFTACKVLADKVFGPHLDGPPPHFDSMSTALITGMWPVVPFLYYPSFFEFTRRLCGLPPKTLPPIYNVLLKMQLLTHRILNWYIVASIVRSYVNFQMWLAIFFQNTMPFLAYLTFSGMLTKSNSYKT